MAHAASRSTSSVRGTSAQLRSRYVRSARCPSQTLVARTVPSRSFVSHKHPRSRASPSTTRRRLMNHLRDDLDEPPNNLLLLPPLFSQITNELSLSPRVRQLSRHSSQPRSFSCALFYRARLRPFAHASHSVGPPFGRGLLPLGQSARGHGPWAWRGARGNIPRFHAPTLDL